MNVSFLDILKKKTTFFSSPICIFSQITKNISNFINSLFLLPKNFSVFLKKPVAISDHLCYYTSSNEGEQNVHILE